MGQKNIYPIAIIGLGTVGGGVYQQLIKKSSRLTAGSNIKIKVVKVLNRSKKRYSELKIPKDMIAKSTQEIMKDPSIRCVVELIGGTTTAKKITLEAFENGKDVVTANKALLAEHGNEIFAAAKKFRRQIYFEASVGGGIPIIKSIRESFISNRVDSIFSIINGTANYILSKMSKEGTALDVVLKEAQEKGYAEADPTFDIEGIDAAHKIAIMSRLIFSKDIPFDSIPAEGITKIESIDIALAKEFGYVIKLLAIAKRTKEGNEIRVQPTLLPEDHLLASINGVYNAVLLTGDELGNMLLAGKGAGRGPTATAVVSDLIDLARITADDEGFLPYPAFEKLSMTKLVDIHSRYYLRFSIVDKPGVLADISNILGKHKISISDVEQRERNEGSQVPLIILTHEASEKKVRDAVKKIDKLTSVKRKTRVFRIEE